MFSIKRNDTGKALDATLVKSDGTNALLSGATVRFIMSDRQNVVIDKPALIIDQTTGKVRQVFESDETGTAGSFLAEFEVTYSDGTTETFPDSGYIYINIEKDLG